MPWANSSSECANYHVAITPDGPRGPRRKMKTGIVFLASHSGRAIIPSVYACHRGWRIRGNWTDMLMPWPFTTIYATGGPPFVVPPNLDREEMQQYVERLEREMERLQALVDQAPSVRGANLKPPARSDSSSKSRAAA